MTPWSTSSPPPPSDLALNSHESVFYLNRFPYSGHFIYMGSYNVQFSETGLFDLVWCLYVLLFYAIFHNLKILKHVRVIKTLFAPLKNKTRPRRGALMKSWQSTPCVRTEELRTLSHMSIQGTGRRVRLGRASAQTATGQDTRHWSVLAPHCSIMERRLVLHRTHLSTDTSRSVPTARAGGRMWWMVSGRAPGELSWSCEFTGFTWEVHLLESWWKVQGMGQWSVWGRDQFSKATTGVPLATRK